MKKKWLIAIATGAMAVTVALGISACSIRKADNPTSGKSDDEIAQSVVNTLNSLYKKDGEVKTYETPDDFTRLAQISVDSKAYAVVWSADVKTTGYAANVQVGTEKDANNMITIDVTRATVDIEYTLTATVTVNKAIKTASYDHKIPAKSSESSLTATLDLTNKDNRTQLDADNNEQTWKQNGVTLFNSGNVADFVPIRLYKNTTVTITMDGAKIIHIDFHSAQGFDDSPYPEYLQQSLEASDLPIKGEIAVSEDGLTFGVDFETPMEEVTFKTTAGQCRLTSIDVEGEARDPNEHVHNWKYEHVANTWTHTATCTAEGCDVKTKTENCTPKLNVCECGYTYTAKEIVDALFALEEGGSLPGTYTLTGVITKVTEVDTNQYKNATFEMTVEGKTVTVFRAKGDHYSEVEVGGTATVNGELLDYGGTKEFTQGGSVVAFTPGVDERTAQQKVDAALAALASTFTVTKAGATTLPVSTVAGVTFAWTTENKTYTITNNTINVTELPDENVTLTATVTATCGTETVTNNTKTVTITINKKASTPTPVDALAAGNYNIVLRDETNSLVWYVTGALTSKGGLVVDKDASKAATITVSIENGKYVLKIGAKYLEAYLNGTSYKNMRLVDTPSTDAIEWKWNTDYQTFSATYSDETRYLGGNYYNNQVGNLYDSAVTLSKEMNFTGTNPVKICYETATGGTVTPPTPSDADATIDFTTTTARQSQTTTEQVWQANGITFTNQKAGSTNDVADFSNPVRCYPSSTVKIEYTSNIVKIVFYSAENDAADTKESKQYFNSLKASLEACDGVTVTVDEENATITVVLTTPAGSFEFTAIRQVRFFSIDVYTNGSAVDPTPTHTCEHVCPTCGKCTDATCQDPVCADKCQGHSTQPGTNYGTLENPLTVTQAIALARELPSGKGGAENFTAEAVYVKGYVIEAGEWSYSAQYGGEWKNVYIADSKSSATSSADAILVFYLHVDDDYLKLSGDLIKGTEIVIYGYVENFAYTSGDSAAGTPEIADYNNVKTKAVAYTVTEQQKADAAVAAVGDLSSASVTEDITLPESTVTGVSFVWTVDDENGTNAKVEGNKVTITRTDSDATVTLTLTATCGAAEATDTYTLKILSSSAAEAELLYTFSSMTAKGSNNGYANNCNVEVDGVTWNVEGNSTMNPWRFGGNSLTGVDRKLTGKTAITGTVSKIVIKFGTCNATVNSITLKVYKSDPTADGAVAAYTQTVSHKASSSVTVEAGAGEEWKDCYYQLVFNVTVSGTGNKYVTVETMEFWGFAASATVQAPAQVAILPGKEF